MRKNALALAAAVALGALVSTPVLAITIPGTLDVSATVVGGCTVGTSQISFLDYDGTLLDATGTINVDCTADVLYSVELGPGNGGDVARQMTKVGDPTTFLPYELYRDSNHTLPWGGVNEGYTTNGAAALTDQTGIGSNQPIPVYGRIEAGQPLSAGSYADTVTVSVIY